MSLRYCPVNKGLESQRKRDWAWPFLLRVPKADRQISFDLNSVRCKTGLLTPQNWTVSGHQTHHNREATFMESPSCHRRENMERDTDLNPVTASRREEWDCSFQRLISVPILTGSFELNSPLPHLTKTVLHLMNLNRGCIVNLEESITEKYSGLIISCKKIIPSLQTP